MNEVLATSTAAMGESVCLGRGRVSEAGCEKGPAGPWMSRGFFGGVSQTPAFRAPRVFRGGFICQAGLGYDSARKIALGGETGERERLGCETTRTERDQVMR